MNLSCKEEHYFDLISDWCEREEISWDFEINEEHNIIAFAYYSFPNYHSYGTGLLVSTFKSFEEIWERCFEDDVRACKGQDEE